MGLITIFTKDGCPYCERVIKKLEELRQVVLAEVEGGVIDVQQIKASGSAASLCVRLTGSLTVPHVFFQTEYIGDSEFTCALAERTRENCCNLIVEKLKKLAREKNPSPPFPPPALASIIKLTEEVAISSQPTRQQIGKLAEMGFATVINLVDASELSFDSDEARLCPVRYLHAPCSYAQLTATVPNPNADPAQQRSPGLSPASLGRSYSAPVSSSSSSSQSSSHNGNSNSHQHHHHHHQPHQIPSPEAVKLVHHLLETLRTAEKPVLVHDSCGKRAAFLGLLDVMLRMHEANHKRIVEWGDQLGFDLKGPYAKIAHEFVATITATTGEAV